MFEKLSRPIWTLLYLTLNSFEHPNRHLAWLSAERARSAADERAAASFAHALMTARDEDVRAQSLEADDTKLIVVVLRRILKLVLAARRHRGRRGS